MALARPNPNLPCAPSGASSFLRARIACWLLVATTLLLGVVASGAEMLFFYENGCPDCARVKADIEAWGLPEEALHIEFLEIHTAGAMPLLERLMLAYGAEVGAVPILFVGDVAMVNRTFYAPGEEPATLSELGARLRLRQVIDAAIAANAASPRERLPAARTELVLVIAPDCEACDALGAMLDRVLARAPDAALRVLDAGGADDAERFDKLKRLYGVHGDAPAVFVGSAAFIGNVWCEAGKPPETLTVAEEQEECLAAAVAAAVESGARSPLSRLEFRERVTLWAVVAAAALDSVNPCDFAVLILLLGTLLVIGRRGKVLAAGLSFTAAIYISYFLLGFLVYSVLGMTIGTRSFRVPFIYAVSGLAILVGLWQMKDLLWYGRFLSIEVPDRWKPFVKKVTSSAVTIPGAFVAGVIDSLFLAPCTSGPYLAILSLLSQTTSRLQGIALLLLYNFIFVIPLLLITVAVHLGLTTTARAERWRTARLGTLHFASGVVMLLLGVGMVIGVRLGYI